MKRMKSNTRLKGSALVFSMLVLTMLLAIAMSSVTLSIASKKSSGGTEKSILAFQVADGAAENVLRSVYKRTDATLNTLATNLYGSDKSCSDGVISGVLPSGSGTYSATFYDNSNAKLQCSGTGYSSYAEWRSKLVHIVVIGIFGGTTRAIDIGITPYP